MHFSHVHLVEKKSMGGEMSLWPLVRPRRFLPFVIRVICDLLEDGTCMLHKSIETVKTLTYFYLGVHQMCHFAYLFVGFPGGRYKNARLL
jgi:hypothetical protein